MKLALLVLDDVFDTGLATMRDAFATANELAELTGLASPRFAVDVVGVEDRVRTAQGLTVPVIPAGAVAVPEIAIVAALGYKQPGPLAAALRRPDVVAAEDVLRQWAGQGTLTTAACIGTFVLAEAGLLDGHVATTTWWLAPWFRQRYPRVQLDESRMIIASPPVVTAGAALGHLDLALWLIRRASPELAAMTARYLIVDSRPAQSAYAITNHLAHADPVVERFDRWAREQLAAGFSLEAAARALGTSPRTLSRRLQAVLGKSPLAYVQDLRVERAVHLLETSQAGLDEIAAQVGYVDGVTLRALLRRRLGRGVRELRPRPEPEPARFGAARPRRRPAEPPPSPPAPAAG
jgi:transcriptional regulator GlxA family with amidase domain